MPRRNNGPRDDFPELSGGRGRGRGFRVNQDAPHPGGRPSQAPQNRPTQAPQSRPTQAPQPQSSRPRTNGGGTPMCVDAPQQQRGSAVVRSGDNSGRSVDAARGLHRGNRSLITDVIVTRPQNLPTKKGATGQVIKVLANYFKVLKKPEWNIYKYRVDFAPEIEETFVKKAVMRRQIERLGCFQFDGTMIFSPVKYPHDPMVLVDRNDKEETQQINIRFVGELLATEAGYTHLLNIIMRTTIEYLNMQKAFGTKGTNYFDPQQMIDIRQYNLQVWPGFCTAIRQHERDIMICTELTHKVIRLESCYSVMQRSARDQDAIKRELIGQTIVTEYNNATYRIDDVDFSQSPSSTFEKKSGERITFIQYFRDRYNVTIRDSRQPLLVSRAKARDIRAGRPEVLNLVPELCRLTGLTDQMRGDFRLMRAMAEHTRVGPAMRCTRYLDFNRRIQNEARAQQMMQKWEMSLDANLVEFPARVLPGEIILFGQNQTAKVTNADWTGAITRNCLYQSALLKNWHIICTNRDRNLLDTFLGQMLRTARNIGMKVTEPRILPIDDVRAQTYAYAIEKACNDSTQMVMCVVPNQDSQRYTMIKKKSLVERSIPTQVVQTKVLSNDRIRNSVAAKILIQINCKLGNAPWSVKIPAGGIMTVGFDVTHDGMDKRRSFGALVATMDLQKSSAYYSTVSQHTHGEEMSNHLITNLMGAMRQYQTIHGEPPKKIFFYRDGVGEGDVSHVVDFEVKSLQQRLKESYGAAAPKLTFIIVTKRINTRLFGKTNGNITNVPPGTVVDDVITLPERYDFFIVSQSTREGTLSPTNYNVIHDESGFNADKIQQWTYKMTHLYYNWSGNVKVPAVCQYAHKLAFLVGTNIHQAPNNLLADKLYFL